MKTKRGIYYNLNESEYKYKVDNFIFVFSSKLYLEKFKETIESKKMQELDHNIFNQKLKCNLTNDDIFYLKYYKTIEKRGFLVYYKDTVLNENYNIKMIID